MKKLSIISTLFLLVFFGINKLNAQIPSNGLQSTSCIHLNGTGGRVMVPGSSSTSILQGSYGAWVKLDVFGTDYQRIIYKQGRVELFYFVPLNRFEAEIVVNGIRYEVYTDSTLFHIDTAQWYHLMVTYDTTDFKLYVNGDLKSVNTIPQGPIDSQLNQWGIGASPTSGAWSFNGQIDEVTIFNRALDSLEVNSLLCSQIDTNNILFSDLVAYYKFDENSDTVANDEINSINGLITPGNSWNVMGMPNFKPQIAVNGNTLSSDLAGISYQWYLDGSPITNETNQTLNALVNGDYQVEVQSMFGCVGISDIESFIYTVINKINNNNKTIIYPNPTNSIFNIDNPEKLSEVILYDITGKMIFSTNNTRNIDVSNLNRGFYFVETIDINQTKNVYKLNKL